MNKLKNKNLKIVQKFVIFLVISFLVIAAGAVMMIVKGMNLGVEFKGGMTISVEVEGVSISNEKEFKDEVNTLLKNGVTINGETVKFNPSSTVQKSGDNEYEFRVDRDAVGSTSGEIDLSNMEATMTTEQQEAYRELDGDFAKAIQSKVSEYVTSKNPQATNVTITVKPSTMGNDVMKATLRNAIIAVSVAVVVILAYIAIRFTLISGVAAVLALLHDVLVMIALTTIFQIPVNATFIAAVITIIGYSINATIVIFDRIRELEKTPSAPLDDKDLANKAIANTLTRSLLTTITTLVMIVSLAIFGNSTIREFALPIIFGLIAGTYSSVLLSASTWVYLRKLFKQSNKRPVAKVKKIENTATEAEGI